MKNDNDFLEKKIYGESKPIFVLGAARSGTSILASSIRKGANITGYNEGHFLPLVKILIKEIDDYYIKKETKIRDKKAFMLSYVNQNKLENAIIDVFRTICNSLYQQEVWIDKTPDHQMIQAAPYLLRVWSESRFIFAKRRGIECINSRLKKFPYVSFENHCKIWKMCMESWLAVRNSLDGHYIEIDQREISINPKLISKKIGDFLNLNQAQTERINSIFLTKRPEFTGGWEAARSIEMNELGWTKEQIKIFRKHCTKVSKNLGYSETSSYYLSVEPTN